MLVNALSVELGTLGAGGGSLVFATAAGEIRVGPESAGGDPGPACYGRGGTIPTMTDAFMAMGILDPAGFNAGRMTLDPNLSLQAFEALDSPLSLEQRIAYAYRIGLNNITEGLIDVAIGRGLDPRDFSLVAFGAAGPLMLPAILNDVRARRVIVPPYPGLFSALGLLSSDLVYTESRSAYVVMSHDTAADVNRTFQEMEAYVREQLPPGVTDVQVRRTFDGRLVGQSWDTPFVEVPGGELDGAAIDQMIVAFHDEYESRYGNRFEQFPVEGVTYRVQLALGSDKVEYPKIERGEAVEIAPDRRARAPLRRGARVKGRGISTRESEGRQHRPGTRDHSRADVDHARRRRPARHDRRLRRDLDREGGAVMTAVQATGPGPRLKELTDAEFEARYNCDRFTATVLSNRFRYIVKHMCTHLVTNAFSVILRDWYDFSAILSGPPELDYPMSAVSDSLMIFSGSMSEGVRNSVKEFGVENLRPGDVLVCNDPIRVGTHPNDICFTRPVFRDDAIVGFVAIQPHMIDVGGTVPAGFSAGKHNIYENGLVIPPSLFWRDDKPIKSAFATLFDNARFGEIMLPDMLSIFADLRLGERLVLESIGRYGLDALFRRDPVLHGRDRRVDV